MIMHYCPTCKADRGFRRELGWGTFFAVLFTAGFWLLVIPFYPLRCKTCGTTLREAKASQPTSGNWWSNRSNGEKIGIFFVVLMALIAISGIFLNQSQTNTPVTNKKIVSNATATTTSVAIPAITPLTKAGLRIHKRFPSWSREACNAIGAHEVFVGMNKTQAELAWGKPYRVNITDTGNDRHEQWVMYDSFNSSYLYFDNGILTAVQTSR